MMRVALFGGAVVVSLATWAAAGDGAAAACSMIVGFPSPIGRATFMMAHSTEASVTAPIEARYGYPSRNATPMTDSVFPFSLRSVPAQVMKIERVTGYQADSIDAGLRARGDSAVFVRYWYGPSCAPIAAGDGGFDGPGTYGLYRGVPRPRSAWIGGRPTFDVFLYLRMPYPSRLMESGYARGTHASNVMTANELFDLYAATWAESGVPRDSLLRKRACDWVRRHRSLVTRVPAAEILRGIGVDGGHCSDQ